ncbi:MAG: hypothetical protein JEZ00_01765 [Anaerolineaceae bacterium]|nr:hypothetical protein [Anaerolineaceae bacterium]
MNTEMLPMYIGGVLFFCVFAFLIYRAGKNLGKSIAFIFDLFKNPEILENVSAAIKKYQNRNPEEK